MLSESAFLACRKGEEVPDIKWSRVLSGVQVDSYASPGADSPMAATKVTIEVDVNGLKVPIDAHMIDEDGTWKWSLTTEALAKCTK